HHHDLHSFPTRRSSDLSVSRAMKTAKCWCGQAKKEKGKRRNGEKAKRSKTCLDSGLRTPDAGLRPTWPSGFAPSERRWKPATEPDRKSTRLNSSHVAIS